MFHNHNNISIDMCVRKIFKCSCIIFKYRLVIHIEYQTDTTFYFITANLHISGIYTVYSRRLCTICFWYHDWCIIFNGNFCEVSKNWSYLSIKKNRYCNLNVIYLNLEKLSNRCFLVFLQYLFFWNRYNYLSIKEHF